jgi:putative heme-binding domain-containing protein
VKKILKLILAFAVVLALLGAMTGVFVYGVVVGKRESFPYSYIRSAEFSIRNVLFADAAEGKKLFEAQCARCHGIDGSGGEGPSLNRKNLRRAPTDEDLRRILRDGLGSMPPAMQSTVNEQAQIVKYVRSLGRNAPQALEGADAGRGAEVYERLECSSCHIIKGEGSNFGPELSEVGALRGPEYLRIAITDPAASTPTGTQSLNTGYTEFLPVRVVTQQGGEVVGVRVGEDAFTIQLRDTRNQHHSFRKSELREMEKLAGKSLMPNYKTLVTPAELEDLVAFLLNQKG